MTNDLDTIKQVYAHFNARDLQAATAAMHPDVVWANGMEGGHVHGREGVHAYWTRQWSLIDPHVEPVRFTDEAEGVTRVDVHLTVRDLEGKLLSDANVIQVFRMENGLVRRFDLREA